MALEYRPDMTIDGITAIVAAMPEQGTKNPPPGWLLAGGILMLVIAGGGITAFISRRKSGNQRTGG